MKYILGLLAITTTLFVGTPVRAADLEDFEASRTIKEALGPLDEGFDWSGPYIGAHAGKSITKDKGVSDFATANADEYENSAGTLKDGALTGGFEIGVRRQISHFVYGTEISLGVFDLSKRADIDENSENKLNAPYKVSGNLYADWTVMSGLAYDRWLVYAKGGLALYNTNAKLSLSPDTYKSDDTLFGWTVGGGVEYALSDKWSLKSEYKYYDFDDFNLTTPDVDVNNDIKVHSFMVGVNYKFR